VLWAAGFNEARANNANDYFIAPPTAAGGCVHASGLNTRVGTAGSTETDLWTNGLPASDLVASRCQFAHTASASAVQGWWLQQYRKTSANSVAGALAAPVAFQWYWDDRVSGADGDAAEVRRDLPPQLRQRAWLRVLGRNVQVTTVRVDVRIRYQDQSQVTGARAGPRLATWVSPHGQQQQQHQQQPALLEGSAPAATGSAQRSVSVSRGPVVGSGSVSTGGSPMSIVLYGALSALVVGAVAAVALAVVAVRRRRRAERLAQAANDDSVTLGVVFQKRCVWPTQRLMRAECERARSSASASSGFVGDLQLAVPAAGEGETGTIDVAVDTAAVTGEEGVDGETA
jgi:hypothetical protein